MTPSEKVNTYRSLLPSFGIINYYFGPVFSIFIVIAQKRGDIQVLIATI